MKSGKPAEIGQILARRVTKTVLSFRGIDLETGTYAPGHHHSCSHLNHAIGFVLGQFHSFVGDLVDIEAMFQEVGEEGLTGYRIVCVLRERNATVASEWRRIFDFIFCQHKRGFR